MFVFVFFGLSAVRLRALTIPVWLLSYGFFFQVLLNKPSVITWFSGLRVKLRAEVMGTRFAVEKCCHRALRKKKQESSSHSSAVKLNAVLCHAKLKTNDKLLWFLFFNYMLYLREGGMH